MTKDRTILLLANSRDENRLMRAVMTVNDNLYENYIWADERIIMTTVRNAYDEIVRYEIEGTALDFFQIGLRYGRAEEMDYVKNLGPVLREIML
jgi:hypothetical protein